MNGIKIRLLLVWSFLLNCNVNDMRTIDIFRYLLGFCMFGGMFSACMPSTDDIEPVRKVEIKISLQEEDFIDTRFANKEVTIRGSKNSYKAVTDEEGVSEKNAPIVHKTIKKVTDDIDTLKMNTAIAALMAMVNEFYSNGVSRGDFEALLLMLSPFAPHVVEELWEQKGFAAKYEGKMAMQCAWPEYDESKTVASSVVMAVVFTIITPKTIQLLRAAGSKAA